MRAADRRIVRLRLGAQRIGASEFTSVLDVVRWMTDMQAQDLPGALWSIGLRLPGSTAATVVEALQNGSIVRSWPLRGTLRRDAMHEVFAQVGVRPDGQRGYHVLWYLAQTGTLVFGPPDGKQQTFALASEWISSRRELERDEALGELALRYFRSHGPASIRDFAWWASLTLRDGEVVGTWKRTLASREVTITTDVFAGSTDRVATGLSRAGTRYATFLGKTVSTGSP